MGHDRAAARVTAPQTDVQRVAGVPTRRTLLLFGGLLGAAVAAAACGNIASAASAPGVSGIGVAWLAARTRPAVAEAANHGGRG